MMEEVIHLPDLVADLKQRVEALERELALRQPAYPAPTVQTPVIDLGALWDNASNGEKRWSEEDFRAP
jgi:hypothetical protein